MLTLYKGQESEQALNLPLIYASVFEEVNCVDFFHSLKLKLIYSNLMCMKPKLSFNPTPYMIISNCIDAKKQWPVFHDKWSYNSSSFGKLISNVALWASLIALLREFDKEEPLLDSISLLKQLKCGVIHGSLLTLGVSGMFGVGKSPKGSL